MQGIKGMEEFFLGIFFSFNELDIIDQNQVRGPIAVAKGLHAIFANRLNQVIGEGLR